MVGLHCRPSKGRLLFRFPNNRPPRESSGRAQDSYCPPSPSNGRTAAFSCLSEGTAPPLFIYYCVLRSDSIGHRPMDGRSRLLFRSPRIALHGRRHSHSPLFDGSTLPYVFIHRPPDGELCFSVRRTPDGSSFGSYTPARATVGQSTTRPLSGRLRIFVRD